MADVYTKGTISDFKKPDRGPAQFKVGGVKVKAWSTLKRDGMEVKNPAFLEAATCDSTTVYVVRCWPRKEDPYEIKAGPRKGEMFDPGLVLHAQDIAVDGTEEAKFIEADTEMWNPSANGSRGATAKSEFVGREPGSNDHWVAIRHAASLVIEAAQADGRKDLLEFVYSDEFAGKVETVYRMLHGIVAGAVSAAAPSDGPKPDDLGPEGGAE